MEFVGVLSVTGVLSLYHSTVNKCNLDVDLNWAWDCVCDICVSNGFIDPRGNINIDCIVVNGKDRVFH